MVNFSKFQSIRIQLIFLLSLSAIIGIFLFSTVLFIYNFNINKNKMILSLSQLTSIMSQNMAASVEFDDNLSAQAILDTFKFNPDIKVALIYKEDMSLFASYTQANMDNTQKQGFINHLTQLYKQHDIDLPFEHIDFNNISIKRMIPSGDETIGSFIIVADTQSLKNSLLEQSMVQLVVSLFALIIIIFVANYLQKIFTAPIFKLKETMEYISANQVYDISIKWKRNNEFRSLFNGFNMMLRIIEQQKQQVESEIAERKQSEQIAEQAKQRLENIANSIPGVVYQFRSCRGELDILFISNGIKVLQNLEPEKIIGNFGLFIQSIYPDDQELVIQAVNQSVNTLNYLDCEYRVLDSRGQIRWIHMEATATELSPSQNKESLINCEENNTEKAEENSKAIILNGNLVDITGAKNAHNLVVKQQYEIQEIHKHTRESIEYASLIQGTLVPSKAVFSNCFDDCFTIWEPKDIVGGDIYFAEELQHGNEFLLMVIDCTGHGVPGAFVTMLVKAVERQIVANILNEDEVVSPAKILKTFNQNIKNILKQENAESVSNAGFDGGILYYNKKQKLVKFAGAETPLFLIQDDKFKIIKGNRHSVGYKKSDPDYEFTEHTINVSQGTKIYLTSDGYLDQNGGAKGFPFGKRKFTQLIEKNMHMPFNRQYKLLLSELNKYQGSEERNDDVTVIGLKI